MDDPILAYLGDAVYAEYDTDGFVVLRTGSHVTEDATNTIYLEPAVAKALVEFITRYSS